MDARANTLEEDLEEILTCVITEEIFSKPVMITKCGHSFEEEVIQKHLSKAKNNSCPTCREPASKEDLKVNISVKQCVETFLKHHPEYIKEQYFPIDRFASLIKKNDIKKIIEIFKQRPDRLNDVIDETGRTILQAACFDQNLPLVKALFENFPDKLLVNQAIAYPGKINGLNLHGLTALILAASKDDNAELVQYLLEKGADPSLKTKDGITALMAAILKRTKNIPPLLNSKQPLNINAEFVYDKDSHEESSWKKYAGYTALMMAIDKVDVDTFTTMLNHHEIEPIDINKRNLADETTLFLAASLGRSAKVEKLIQFPDIDVEAMRASDGKTAFMIAADNGYTETVSAFTSPTAKFHLAQQRLAENRKEEACQLLGEIYHMVDSESFQKYLDQLHEDDILKSKILFEEILELAVEKRDNDLLIKLLQLNPGNLFTAKSDLPVLHLAVLNNNLDLVEKLFELFPLLDVNQKVECNSFPNKGRTPAHMLVSAKSNSEEAKAMLDFLCQKKLDLGMTSASETTPLILALSKNRFDIVKILFEEVDQDLNINQATKAFSLEGYTALHYLANKARHSLLRTFIQKFQDQIADINVRTQMGESALFMAAANGDLETINILCGQNNIDMEAKRLCDGKTAEKIAVERKHEDVVAFFQCYRLLKALLDNQPIDRSIRLDSIALMTNSFSVLNKVLTNQGYPARQIDFLITFLEKMKDKQRPDLHAVVYNLFTKERSEIAMLNRLFNFAHETYFKNKIDWEVKVRDVALDEVTASVNHFDETKKSLREVREEPVMKKYRHLLSWGRTNTQIKIDKMLSSQNEPSHDELNRRVVLK